MSKRRIVLQPDVEIPFATPAGPSTETYSHGKFIDQILDNDERFGGRAGAKVAIAISDELVGKSAGDSIDLRDTDWETLRDAVVTPQGWKMSPKVSRRAVAFMDAIVEAEAIPAHPQPVDIDRPRAAGRRR